MRCNNHKKKNNKNNPHVQESQKYVFAILITLTRINSIVVWVILSIQHTYGLPSRARELLVWLLLAASLCVACIGEIVRRDQNLCKRMNVNKMYYLNYIECSLELYYCYVSYSIFLDISSVSFPLKAVLTFPKTTFVVGMVMVYEGRVLCEK